MNKKYLLIIIPIILIITTILITDNKISKYNGPTFYLDEKYYNQGIFIDTTKKEIEQLINTKSSFLLFTYNHYCTLPIPCEDIFEETLKKYNIDILQIKFEDLKNTSLYKTIKLAPTIIIFKDGKIIDYLKADSNDHLDEYQNTKSFEKWLKKYLILETQNKSV